jgi:hypothetical protein
MNHKGMKDTNAGHWDQQCLIDQFFVPFVVQLLLSAPPRATAHGSDLIAQLCQDLGQGVLDDRQA